jgi:hypothetical protein
MMTQEEFVHSKESLLGLINDEPSYENFNLSDPYFDGVSAHRVVCMGFQYPDQRAILSLFEEHM